MHNFVDKSLCNYAVLRYTSDMEVSTMIATVEELEAQLDTAYLNYSSNLSWLPYGSYEEEERDIALNFWEDEVQRLRELMKWRR